MDGAAGAEGAEPRITVLRVLRLADAAVGSGALVVLLRRRQGPDPGPRRRLGAGRLRLLQAAVVVAVLGRVLQVRRLIGCGEGHAAVGELDRKEDASISVLKLAADRKRYSELMLRATGSY